MKSIQWNSLLKSLGFWILFLLSGCNSVSVFSDFDPAIDRSRYVTYSWLAPETGREKEDDPLVSPFVYNRIHSAVDRELARRGFQLKTSVPTDFIVKVRVEKELRSVLYQQPFFYPRIYSRGYYRHQWLMVDPWWSGSYGYSNAIRFYEDGYLMLNITDGRTGRLAWRGAAWGALTGSLDPDSNQKAVDRTVSTIIEKFSPMKNER
jgi:hypothetical protein